MILYNYEFTFQLENEKQYTEWLKRVCMSERHTFGELAFIFCSDDDLLSLNQKYLGHDYYTDVITFDYVSGRMVSGDIYISVERVFENAKDFGVSKEDEMKRVMVHGLLHLLGYADRTEAEKAEMRQKEVEKIKLFHVEL